MKGLKITVLSFALVSLFITGCNTKAVDLPKPNTNQNTNTNQNPPVVQEKKTPLEIMKETQKVIATMQGYKFSRVTLEKGNGQPYNNTESGVEQLNPQIAHFTNSRGAEYYYDSKNIYLKKDGQWLTKANTDGKVLVSVLFTNNVKFLIENLGTKSELPGITAEKKGNDYIVTIDYLLFKDPSMTDSQYQKAVSETQTRKTQLTVNATTFEPKRYSFNYETKDGTKVRSVELDLTNYVSPITIPSDVIQNAKISS